MLSLGVAIMGIGAILLIVIPNTVWFIIFWSFLGVGMGAIDSSSAPELADIADNRFKDSYGKIFAISNTANGFGFILGPVIGTGLIAAVDFGWTWTITGIVLVVYAVSLFLKQIKKMTIKFQYSQPTKS